MSLKQQAVSFKPGAVSSEPLKTLSSGPDFPCYSGPCFYIFAPTFGKKGAHTLGKKGGARWFQAFDLWKCGGSDTTAVKPRASGELSSGAFQYTPRGYETGGKHDDRL